MSGRLVTALAVAAAATPLLCILPLAVIGGVVTACGTADHRPTATDPNADPHGGWDREQTINAATIIDVGLDRRVPRRGWVIAVAVAMQESDLRNLDHRGDRNDHDSLGLFQQRPSQGWGTPEQILDPHYAANAFYTRLQAIPDWPQLPLTEAAQQVQRSAYPDAYAARETDATALVDRLVPVEEQTPTTDLAECVDPCPATAHSPTPDQPTFDQTPPGRDSSCEWVAPVTAPVVSGFRTAGRPSHNGVDLGAARGTPIRAAAAGTVITMRCNVNPASHGCDQDGSPSIRGCGWYVDLRHNADVTTRYCHMSTRPFVTQGQAVAAGQILGIVGSSGNSSGPHLHFEVHIADEPVDPVTFMATRAPIGQNR